MQIIKIDNIFLFINILWIDFPLNFRLDIEIALKNQLHFTENIFHPIIKDLNSSQYHVAEKYLGNFFGQLSDVKLNGLVKGLATRTPNVVRKEIYNGLKAAKASSTNPESSQFVSFLVATKRQGSQKATDMNLDMHMCVYTVRKDGDVKNSIFFDPAPPCHQRSVSNYLLKLRQPELRSATLTHGPDSQANDCLYQCFKYLIGIQTGLT